VPAPRAVPPLALVALAALGLGCPPREHSAEACFAAVQRGFEAVRAAAQLTTETCLGRGAGRSGSVEACIAGDPIHLVSAARARALAAEARACRAGALPAFGYVGARAASDAALASARALARGLFGPDLDAARAPHGRATQAARCQAALLEAAGDCAGRFVREYGACATRALAEADDAFDLVACKGEDARGAIARACEDAVEAALARSCGGLDAAPLFPGCAGSAADCARGHARRSASLALNDANGLCQDLLMGSLDERRALECFEPPPPEPVELGEVPLPDGVNVSTVEWEGSGERLIVGFTAPGVTGNQLASVRPDGGEFRCLTCGSAVAGNLRPVQRLRDGRRVLVAGPNNPLARWHLLECTPSVDDCQSSQLVPIALPANPDPTTPILQYRVPWVTLDDAWLVWSEVRLRGPGGNLSAMGRLVRDADRYVVSDARVIAPPLRSLALGSDSAPWSQLTQPFEAKFGGLRGGLDWVEAGTPSAGQYDTSLLDLTSGALRRLTRHPDHDEGVRFTRDEQWAVLQSARTDQRVEFLGLLPRPPFIDWIAFSIHFVAIAGAPSDGLSPGGDPDERDCYVDPWLLDRWFERGHYIGQRLLRPEDGWVSIEGNAGGFGWSPDGTRIALIERRWRGESPGARLRIAALPNRTPIQAADVVGVVPTPEPGWALRYEDWVVPDTSGISVIPGRVSGTATIRNDMPSTLQGEVEVVYDDYSDDGEHVLEGFERLRIPSLIVSGAAYEVDLALSGARTGSMRGGISYDFVADVNSGEVVSELDGRVSRGPRTCYEAGLIPIP
jgi:hypothetical protein